MVGTDSVKNVDMLVEIVVVADGGKSVDVSVEMCSTGGRYRWWKKCGCIVRIRCLHGLFVQWITKWRMTV